LKERKNKLSLTFNFTKSLSTISFFSTDFKDSTKYGDLLKYPKKITKDDIKLNDLMHDPKYINKILAG